jgi:hypothetical protein
MNLRYGENNDAPDAGMKRDAGELLGLGRNPRASLEKTA